MSASLNQRIDIFHSVRDVPYEINLLDRKQDSSCISKAIKLQKMLKEINIESRRICCRFAWKETPLAPALYVLAIAPTSSHQYLEALIPETRKWVAVDPTWDVGLKAAGFPIAEWDGLSATILAVKPLTTPSAKKGAQIIEEDDAKLQEEWADLYQIVGPFTEGFNNFLKSCRSRAGMHHASMH
jgi:hypothetical protein